MGFPMRGDSLLLPFILPQNQDKEPREEFREMVESNWQVNMGVRHPSDILVRSHLGFCSLNPGFQTVSGNKAQSSMEPSAQVKCVHYSLSLANKVGIISARPAKASE